MLKMQNLSNWKKEKIEIRIEAKIVQSTSGKWSALPLGEIWAKLRIPAVIWYFCKNQMGAGEEVAYCLPIIPPELQKVTSSRCHSIKATKYYCPLLYTQSKQSSPEERSQDHGQWRSSCHQWFLVKTESICLVTCFLYISTFFWTLEHTGCIAKEVTH